MIQFPDLAPSRIRTPNDLPEIAPDGGCDPQGIGALFKRAWDEEVAPRHRSGEPAPGMRRERFLRLLNAAGYLAAHIHEAPVWIVPCPEGGTPTRTSGSSIYPAVQSMLLAALKGDRDSPWRSRAGQGEMRAHGSWRGSAALASSHS